MLIRCADVLHPLQDILSRFIVQYVVYERSGCGYVSGTFTDEKSLRDRRLLDSRDVVLIVPNKICPMLWASEIQYVCVVSKSPFLYRLNKLGLMQSFGAIYT